MRSPLTARQQEVIQLASQGKCQKEIARELGITVKTVKAHVFIARKVVGHEMVKKMIFRNA
jgi:DNA-binding NarL/FixJ family response regulator